jgi:CDP-glycerol glycerophosphotransferase (TagB/SpsB family)
MYEVRGTMNQMVQEINNSMAYKNIAITDISAYRFSAWLSDRPCLIK